MIDSQKEKKAKKNQNSSDVGSKVRGKKRKVCSFWKPKNSGE